MGGGRFGDSQGVELVLACKRPAYPNELLEILSAMLVLHIDVVNFNERYSNKMMPFATFSNTINSYIQL